MNLGETNPIPVSLITFVTITTPFSPAGLQVWDRSIQGTSRAKSFPFFIISIAWVESHEQIVSVLSILCWNFHFSTFAVFKNMSSLESLYYIGIANILQWNQTFNIIRSCQVQSYTIPLCIYSNLSYCQFQGDAINSFCVCNLQDRNWLVTYFVLQLICTSL